MENFCYQRGRIQLKWTSKEVDVYLSSKEYIDTAFITLIPFGLRENMKQIVSMGEFSTVLTHEIERQLHGRTLVIPPFTYLKTENEEKRLYKLLQWVEELQESGFKYIFLFTSDNEWKLVEDKLKGMLIWIPAIPLEHMDDKYRSEILQEQTQQVLQIVTNQWQSSS